MEVGRGSPSIYIKLHQISREAELQDFKRLQDKNKNNNEWQEPGRVLRFRRFSGSGQHKITPDMFEERQSCKISRYFKTQGWARQGKDKNMCQEPGRVSRFRRFRLLICRVDSWAFY